MNKKLLKLIPLIVFLIFVIVVVYYLLNPNRQNPRDIPSPLIGKPVPAFTLPDFDSPGKTISNTDMKGKVWLLNFWASWCISCRDEHPVLVQYKNEIGVPIVGVDYKDVHADGQRWLSMFGNPYTKIVIDAKGDLGLNIGVYGVPETYLIDRQGIIRYKQIGQIDEEILNTIILPKIKELSK